MRKLTCLVGVALLWSVSSVSAQTMAPPPPPGMAPPPRAMAPPPPPPGMAPPPPMAAAPGMTPMAGTPCVAPGPAGAPKQFAPEGAKECRVCGQAGAVAVRKTWTCSLGVWESTAKCAMADPCNAPRRAVRRAVRVSKVRRMKRTVVH